MPSVDPLNWLIDRLTTLIRTATDSLEQSYPDGVDAWQQEISRELARYHAAAMLAGAGVDDLSPTMRTQVMRDLTVQLSYLEQFGVVIQDADQFMPGWQARAAMYARSIQVPYWQGVTKLLPLPAMPGESGQCLTNCKCMWDVQELEGDNNYDCYWLLGATEEHCQTCNQRAISWAPLRIRDGELQL